jgi:hypothetical protein
MHVMDSTLRLFKGIYIPDRHKNIDDEKYQAMLKITMPRGFIISSEILPHINDLEKLVYIIDKYYGLGNINNTFQSSWKKIQDSKMEDLVLEQITHYMTTYGKNMFINMNHDTNDNYIYIPYKDLNVPQLDIEGFKFTMISGYDEEELKEKIFKIISSGIALKDDTMNDLIEIMTFLDFGEKELELIKNKEMKSRMYLYLNLVPENNIEFLRLLIYKCTGKTLIIKNGETIEKIKSSSLPDLELTRLFKQYNNKVGYEKLAEIFYRFKPLWLAFRQNNELKMIINSIRRWAIKFHKPMKEDYLNALTSELLKTNSNIDITKLLDELSKVNIFRKIRLAYALKYRSNINIDSILYKVRNGKSYAKEFVYKNNEQANLLYKPVLHTIISDIEKIVKGKKIFIPKYMTYTLPATEKQFTGNIPSGSYVEIDKDMIFGVYWENIARIDSIDLDLSMTSINGKYGWDRQYRSSDNNILFSGDMTDARDGATELFYIKNQSNENNLVLLNFYNRDYYSKDINVPYKIIVAQEKLDNLPRNYMIDPNNILVSANCEINCKQKMIGLALTDDKKSRFYFCETQIGNSITSSNNNDYSEHARKYLFNFYGNSISLNEILVNAGAMLVDAEDCDIDLSPEKLEKDTILKLLVGDK